MNRTFTLKNLVENAQNKKSDINSNNGPRKDVLHNILAFSKSTVSCKTRSIGQQVIVFN